MSVRFDPPLGSPPCGGCTRCCEKDAVFLHPELGDDPRLYETVEMPHMLTGKPSHMLKRGADGVSCGYLEKGVGCTIYEKRPAMCREFDCRGFYLRLSRAERKSLVARGLATKEMFRQGRAMIAKTGRITP